MVLCGYTFGVWEGFVVSYIASLTGAIVVFIVSRTLLRDVITKRYVLVIRRYSKNWTDIQSAKLSNGNLVTPHYPIQPPSPTSYSNRAVPLQPPQRYPRFIPRPHITHIYSLYSSITL
jgi:hypothetical protein